MFYTLGKFSALVPVLLYPCSSLPYSGYVTFDLPVFVLPWYLVCPFNDYIHFFIHVTFGHFFQNFNLFYHELTFQLFLSYFCWYKFRNISIMVQFGFCIYCLLFNLFTSFCLFMFTFCVFIFNSGIYIMHSTNAQSSVSQAFFLPNSFFFSYCNTLHHFCPIFSYPTYV